MNQGPCSLYVEMWLCQASNGLGVLFGTLQLVIYAIYRNKSTQPPDEKVKGQEGVQIEALDPWKRPPTENTIQSVPNN